MSRILLLGAGFSRNWGGWLAAEAFEYLLGCPEVASDPHLRALLWYSQSAGGYENALTEAKVSFDKEPSAANETRLQTLRTAVARMFEDMNHGYFSRNDFEFQKMQPRKISTFLARFDAIYTLNQDLLLEHHYFDNNVALHSNGRWGGAEIPGMRHIRRQEAENSASWASGHWIPAEPINFHATAGLQPYYKLHGSSNWRTENGGPMLIMGGNKAHEIGLSPVLRWYHDKFAEQLSQTGTRLMIIGYGFADEHINSVLTRSIFDHGTLSFIIDPQGADAPRRLGPHGEAALMPSEIEGAFHQSLIGASRRALRDIFGGDTIEHNKVQRFFAA